MAMATTLSLLLLQLLLLYPTHSINSLSELDLLLTFKSSINDPTFSLSSWSNKSNTNYCNWTYITCTNFSSSVSSINLQSLNLSGDISPSICHLPSLSSLNLAKNFFNEPIPLQLSECTKLLTLNLSNNLFWGTVPDQFSLLSSLQTLDLSGNKIEGQIPVSFGSFSSLQILNLGRNLFSGAVHHSIFANLSQLVFLDLSQNPTLFSELPQEIGNLTELKRVYMQNSGFYGEIPKSFMGLSQLEFLDLSQNNLTGEIPLDFGLKLPKLVSLDLSQNKLSGQFSTDVCYGKSLVELNIHNNYFSGLLPKSLENCSTLQRIQLQDNGFNGEFPIGLWSLPDLRVIRAENNRFSGQLLDLNFDSSQLEQVQIDNNSFIGPMPQFLGSIKTMYRFSASMNRLNGTLPNNLCDSPVISIINFSHNSLSGFIPELQNCKRLVSISLADNNLTGEIPASLGQLPVLTYIDLSSNKLTGEIPQDLGNLKLALFNVSFNNLYGSVPPSLISGLPASYLQGNPGLCGPGLPNQCNFSTKGRNSRINGLVLALIVVSVFIGVTLLSLGIFILYKIDHGKSDSSIWKSVLYYPIKITQEELVMGLTEKNVIGRGAFGKVYLIQIKGTREFVVVKRLFHSSKLSSRNLKSEMKTLAKIRHKNINKLLGFLYSDNELILLYEYLQKGSLGDLIYGPDFTLEWRERVKIALGIAQGLAYLHRDYIPSILHRDLKSNNVLVDDEFQARVTGFGLDRIVGEKSYKTCIASDLSYHCYIAPEEGCTEKPTEQMDIYSYGVILLELITGRPAEQPASRESVDIVKWVRRKVNVTDGPYQILDPNISKSSQQGMLVALELALRCTSVMPDKRPEIEEIIRVLQSLYHRGSIV